ncbi:uncharacterized protein LOC123514177 [Portunus trituberculatus]|uniref:Uncharacterized protein n=1 Tax=Portunus trituberculatus TaxID=210409 RepID=A0A5B7EWE9_PORTR|nr:uncharacterized protein LOC123514177 [Portunus trituberculatus]MPC37349.1 hypothetical protein [Portunus trituberculatus]
MKERQPDTLRPLASGTGQEEPVDKSPNYSFHFPCQEEGLGGSRAAAGVRGRLLQAPDQRATRVSLPGAYGATDPRCSSHFMERGTDLCWGPGDTDSRRRSYPLRGIATAGAAYGPASRSSFTPRTSMTAPLYLDRGRFQGIPVYQGGCIHRMPDMQTFQPAPHHSPRHESRRSRSHEPSFLSDDAPLESLCTASNTHTGCKKAFLTEAASCSTRLSDSPETRITSQTEPQLLEGAWNYNMWRAARSPSCCSTNTIYANTSDPGVPQPTYENVFECLVHEGSTPPIPSPGWPDEPIYATLGGQVGDEGVTDFMGEESPDQAVLEASQTAAGKHCPSDDKDADSSSTDSGDEFNPSASTLTLRPGGDGQACEAGDHETEEQNTTERGHAHASDTPPPPLPPKLLKKKPPGLKLHIPETVPATEDYGLQVRLPVERDGNLVSSSSGVPPAPSSPGSETVRQDQPGNCRQGSLYVVVGSSSASSTGEPRYKLD